MKQTIEVRKFSMKDHIWQGPREQILEFPEPQMTEQLVDVPTIVVELAAPSGEAGSFGTGANDTTSAAATAVAKLVDEARPLGTAKYSATSVSESELVEMICAAVVKSVGGARPRVGRGSARDQSTRLLSGVQPVHGQVLESVQGGR